MIEARRLPTRNAAVDALRALALLPVVAVNWLGYSALPSAGPLATAEPAGSWWAQGWLIAVITLLAGKGVTLLTFLFGYGQGLSRRARGDQAVSVRRRRVGRLLVLGLAHGVFIYMGDVLTLYAVCGWVMLSWSRLRLRQLLCRMWALVAAHTLLVLLAFPVFLLMGAEPTTAPLPSLAAASSWPNWVVTNASGFLLNQMAVLMLGLLMPMALMTAGLMAARLQLFTHRRWRALLSCCAQRWLLPGLLVNLAWGVCLWLALVAREEAWTQVLYLFYTYVAVLWLVGLVPWLVLAAQRGVQAMKWLASGGRHTLSMYIGSSLLSLVFLSGAGLALPLGTAALAMLSLTYWLVWIALTQRLAHRLPLETWLSR